jgi:hypothetical protein
MSPDDRRPSMKSQGSPMRKMNAKDVIKNYLKDNNYDGMCCPGKGCSCHINDLFTCGDIPFDCLAGYKITQDDGGWIIRPPWIEWE